LMQEIAEQYAVPEHKSSISNPSCGKSEKLTLLADPLILLQCMTV